MYVIECVADDGLARIVAEGWRTLREEEPAGMPPEPAGEAWKQRLVNDLMHVNYGDRDPSTGHLAAWCYPYDEIFALLSPSELKQRRLRWELRPSRAQFLGGMSILVSDDRAQVRLPLREGAADDPDFWRRVWACLRVLAEAELHAYDIQLERALDLQRDQEAVRQKYREVVDDIFSGEEEGADRGFASESE